MPIEKRFDISFIASLALREKQIQQNYRPIIAVHKWFARRPGTLFRGLMLSEFSNAPLIEAFYSSNDLRNLTIADPFMGGGTPLIEANRLGCNVIGHDINPMSWWVVNRELEHLDLKGYLKAAGNVTAYLEEKLGELYRTKCDTCGNPSVPVKYFLWVKQADCPGCGESVDLFPGYLVAEDKRHPLNILVCPACGELTETASRTVPGQCRACNNPLTLAGPAKRSRCTCPRCNREIKYPDPAGGPPRHRMFAIEYHCPACKDTHKGRFFKKPAHDDLDRYEKAKGIFSKLKPAYIPDDEIPSGDETTRLHRWGYHSYRELFNDRQLLGLELLARKVAEAPDQRIRDALITNLSDLLRYQNMLCRYDTMALKSLDIFSVHGFPVGLVQCESNLIGIMNGGGMSVGSGGWTNIVEKFRKAKTYCDAPFEIRHTVGRKSQVFVQGEWIGDTRNGTKERDIKLFCDSATKANLPPESLDGIFTDPPYFENVQYAELMDFCYVWVRKLAGEGIPEFRSHTTRNVDELTGNVTMERGLDHFTEGLSAVFQRMAAALKPGRPFAFTYHHNRIDAYYPIAVAILDSGLTCSASLPCPAEMGGSIHINGTGSSIIDTVFVCRSTGSIPRSWITDSSEGIALLVLDDLKKLEMGGVKPTRGDIRCIIYGHLIRLAVWSLKAHWKPLLEAKKKLAIVAEQLRSLPQLDEVESVIVGDFPERRLAVNEEGITYAPTNAEITF